eukprot:2036402-Rhodomonas_salina.1
MDEAGSKLESDLLGRGARVVENCSGDLSISSRHAFAELLGAWFHTHGMHYRGYCSEPALCAALGQLDHVGIGHEGVCQSQQGQGRLLRD